MSDFQQAVLNKIRKNKFIMVVSIPKILKEIDSNSVRSNTLLNLDSLQYSVYGIPLPKISIPNIPLGIMGQTYQVTSQTREAYSPITVNFTVDNLLNNYWVIWKWMNILNNNRDSGMPEHFATFKKDITASQKLNATDLDVPRNVPSQLKRMANSYTNYQTIMTVFIDNEYNQKIAEINYYNAFPIELGEITFSNRDPQEAESHFTFAFSQLDIKLLDV